MFEIVNILIMCFVFMLPNGDVGCVCGQISKPSAVVHKKERPKPIVRMPKTREAL